MRLVNIAGCNCNVPSKSPKCPQGNHQRPLEIPFFIHDLIYRSIPIFFCYNYPMNRIWRAVIEMAFIVFLFYSNLLMGEFTRSKEQGMTLVFAVERYFYRYQFYHCHHCSVDRLCRFEFFENSYKEVLFPIRVGCLGARCQNLFGEGIKKSPQSWLSLAEMV